MQIFEAGQKFTMNYATYDQNASLFVAFSIYDITSGTAVFVTKVAAAHLAFGVYSAQYIGLAAKTYLAIGAVYDDAGFTILAQMRSPVCDTYQAKDVALVNLFFSYGTYDENDSLFLQANLYDTTGASPVLVDVVRLTNVAIGCYFGVYVGAINKNYEADIAVYTDGNYSEVDPNRSPACESFNCVLLSGVTLVLNDAILEAQSTSAILEADDCIC